jgi:DNA-binding NarL/FixJ family response regulator
MTATPIRVVVADDHALYLEALILTLNAQPDMVVVGYGQSADEAVALAAALEPDLVLLDLNMPGNGLTAAAAITQLRPDIHSVIITAQSDDDEVARARHAGACGYILKGIAGRELIRLLHTIMLGDSVWTHSGVPAM